MARPTKYRQEYCDLLLKQFRISPYYEIKVQKRTKNGYFYTKTVRKPNDLPTFTQFALSIGISRETLHEWAKPENEDKYEGFSYAYRVAKSLQKDILIQNGLLGLYKSGFAIFMAKAITDLK